MSGATGSVGAGGVWAAETSAGMASKEMTASRMVMRKILRQSRLEFLHSQCSKSATSTV
jgi:hypothetical protein